MRAFLEQLRQTGELLVINKEVEPEYELAAVTRAAQLQSDAVLLFESVTGSKHPVVTNLYASRRRLCQLIQAEDDQFCQRWNTLLDKAQNYTDTASEAITTPPELITGNLSELPLITYHELDAGPYFTSAIYLAKDPETGTRNLSFHRSMYVSDNELRIRLGSSHDLAKYQAKAEAHDQPLEVVALIGVEPAIFMAAATSLPSDWDEFALAAAINGEPIQTYPARSVDLDIPVTTQFVIEGHILPHERREEGPFGEFMGYYVPQGDNHVFEIKDVYWQQDAVFHSLLCGSAEDLSVLEATTATKVYRYLQERLPGIVDVSCAPTFLNTTVKIKKEYDRHPDDVIKAAIEADQDYNKAVFVVDEDVNIHDMNEVIWSFLTRGRADTRTTVIKDLPGFYRDPHKDHWGRLGLDCTRPIGREDEFIRKSVPGVDAINLDDYIKT